VIIPHPRLTIASNLQFASMDTHSHCWLLMSCQPLAHRRVFDHFNPEKAGRCAPGCLSVN